MFQTSFLLVIERFSFILSHPCHMMSSHELISEMTKHWDLECLENSLIVSFLSAALHRTSLVIMFIGHEKDSES